MREIFRPAVCALSAACLAFALSAVPGLIAGIFYAMLRVTRDTYETTRQALAARNATQASP